MRRSTAYAKGRGDAARQEQAARAGERRGGERWRAAAVAALSTPLGGAHHPATPLPPSLPELTLGEEAGGLQGLACRHTTPATLGAHHPPPRFQMCTKPLQGPSTLPLA